MIKRIVISFLLYVSAVNAGPYTEKGISAYIGADWRSAATYDSDCFTNPIFNRWASSVSSYYASSNVGYFNDTSKALGEPTGEDSGLVCLGEVEKGSNPLSTPGQITLDFSADGDVISNKKGYDFAIFENGFVANSAGSDEIAVGQSFVELAYVEVSTNGVDFVRFPSVSLTPAPTGIRPTEEYPCGEYPFLTLGVSNLFNLAGKHTNTPVNCSGTPFDLNDLVNDPLVGDKVFLDDIRYIRIIDIPGHGYYYDQAYSASFLDPFTRPLYNIFGIDNPIYDGWPTDETGGFDLDAVGVLEEQEYSADINLDGLVDLYDFVLFASSWEKNFGEDGWIERCNMALPRDTVINLDDLLVFVSEWQCIEKWRTP